MKRRTVLAGVGGFLALTGCLEGSGGNDPYQETDTPGAGLVDESFEVTSIKGGTETQEASASFGDRVDVEGTTTGNNGCYTAELADATVEGGELDVTVEAVEDKDDDEMCTEALVLIDYEASFEFEGELPDRVVVNHDSMGEVRTVTEAER